MSPTDNLVVRRASGARISVMASVLHYYDGTFMAGTGAVLVRRAAAFENVRGWRDLNASALARAAAAAGRDAGSKLILCSADQSSYTSFQIPVTLASALPELVRLARCALIGHTPACQADVRIQTSQH